MESDAVILLVAIVVLIFTLPRDYVQREIAPLNSYDMYKQAKIDKGNFITQLKLNAENNKLFTKIDTSALKPEGNVFIIVFGESVYRGRMSC